MFNVYNQTEVCNHRMRKVKNVYSFSCDRFLKNTEGNLLINGGDNHKRCKCLVEYIKKERERSNRTIVVFSEDSMMEEQLITEAERGTIGQLFVCNETNNVYDFFCSMKKEFVKDYFKYLANEEDTRDTSEMLSYLEAFLSILSARSPLSLRAMKAFSQNDDTSISNVAQSAEERNMLVSSTKGGVLFRSLLKYTSDVLAKLALPSASTEFCLSKLMSEDCVVLIKIPEANYKIFSLYFASELKSLVGESFVCVFDDSIMINCREIRSVIEILKQRKRADVVLSLANIISFEDGEEMLKNFNCNLIFLDGSTPAVDLQKVLSSFGQYTHMKPMIHRTTAPKMFFTPYTSDGEMVISYLRDRVILQEEEGNEALLKEGRSSELIITKKLKA